MHLLIDFRPLSGVYLDGSAEGYITCFLISLEREYPQLKCTWLTDRTGSSQPDPDLAGEEVLIKKSLPGSLGWKLWNEQVLPRAARQLKADLVLLTGGVASPRLKIPQAVWIPGPVSASASGKEKAFARQVLTNLPATARLAQVLFTGSEETRQRISQQVPQAGHKIIVLAPAASEHYRTRSWEEKARIRESLTGGAEYFLVTGRKADSDRLTDVLRAFSLFKKRQQSRLQLVISVRQLAGRKEWERKLGTYKYRSEVQLTVGDGEEEMSKKYGAAYALIQLDQDEPGLFGAFQSGTPVLSLAGKYPGEISGEAVLYGTPEEVESLAGLLKLVYKNEDLKNELAEKGRERSGVYPFRQSAGLLWDGIQRAVEKER